MDQLIFTPAAILDLLSNIDELSEYDISVVETSDNQIQLTVGNSTYNLLPEINNEIIVDEDAVEEVIDSNMAAYESFEETDVDINDNPTDDINAGFLKEIAKTLLLGGMLKLSSKLLNK